MTTYRQRAEAAEEALRKYKAAHDPVARLLAHSTLVEALLAVVMKHNLLDEFVAENSRLAKLMNEREASRQPPQSSREG